MQAEHDQILDSLLCEWHQWSASYRLRGGSSGASATSNYQCSRQYDDANGALDAEVDVVRMKAFDAQVNLLSALHRVAIHCQARALTVGVVVFTSPRLPADRQEREAVVRAARYQLIQRLVTTGLI